MESKIVKRPKKELDSIPPPNMTVINLKKEIARLKEYIDKLEAKIKKQDTTILTIRNRTAQAVHRFAVVQAKYDKLVNGLKEANQPFEVILRSLNNEHDIIFPPKK